MRRIALQFFLLAALASVAVAAHAAAAGVSAGSAKAVKARPAATYSAAYKAGYRKGYAAGRAAARRELAHPNTCSPARNSTTSPPAGGNSRSNAAAPAAAATSTYSSYVATSAADLTPRSATPGPVTHGAAASEIAAPGSIAPGSATAGPTAPGPDPAGPEDLPLPTAAALHLGPAVAPSALRGSLASLERQNQRLIADGLERIEDEDDLSARIAHRLLVPIPASTALTVNRGLAPNHRYCRPWTARFLTNLSRGHYAAFHRPLEVNSAVRTVEYQRRLAAINSNAAPAEGDLVSPHLMGSAVDIAKKGISRQELQWMRRRLLALQSQSKIDAEEEFEQACFHITVYRSYAAAAIIRKPAKPKSAAARTSSGAGRERTTQPLQPSPTTSVTPSGSTLMAERGQ